MDSILTSIKKYIGIHEEDTSFDMDIVMHINTVFSYLHQLGVGPLAGFSIEDRNSIWDDYIDDKVCLGFVQSYMYQKVKILFDGAALSSTLLEAMNRQIAELEWRILERMEG